MLQPYQPHPTILQPTLNPYLQLGLSVPEPDAIPYRLVVSLAGFEKTGKTHFALTGRPPIVVVNLDVGLEGVAEKFKAAGKEVYIHNIPLVRPTSLIESDDGASKEIWQRQWRELNVMLSQVYALNPGTVILDTWTEGYELARLAHFGKLSQVQAHQYGPVFAEMRSVIRQAYASRHTTTVFVHKMGLEYETKVPEVKGWNQMDFHVQVNLRNGKNPAPAGFGLEEIYTQIKDCRQNPDTNGYLLQEATFSLEYLEWFVLRWRP